MPENINFVPKKSFEKVIAKGRKLGKIVVERKYWEGQLCAGIFLGSCQGMTRLGVERKDDFL